MAVRSLADFKAVVPVVAGFEPAMRGLSDAELRAVTDRLRSRLGSGEGLDGLLPEGFAAVREAARRGIGQRHRDVQILAGAAVHAGVVAEVEDGEGKTLSAILPAYLGGLAGRGVHVLTMTTDLAHRDAASTAPVYRALGLAVGVIPDTKVVDPEARRMAYAAHVTYGSCDDMACDYLRDNMVKTAAQPVQRGHAVAIVDDAEFLLVNRPIVSNIVASAGSEEDSRRVLARVTRRGYLRLYERLGGMSATVASAAMALELWFGLDVVRIPPHRLSLRVEHADELHLTREDQFAALARMVADGHATGRPILIHAPEEVAAVSRLLDQRAIEHTVVSTAEMAPVTATEVMAEVGRWARVSVLSHLPVGVDIPLGRPLGDGDERQAVIDVGGLLAIGLERHGFIRRRDERFSQCVGRRGEPGESHFVLRWDEEDLAEWGDDPEESRARIRPLLEGGELPGLGHLTAIIATAQWAAEAEWAASQDPLISHDDLETDRRNAFYAARRWALHASPAEWGDVLRRASCDVAAREAQRHCPADDDPGTWDLDGLVDAFVLVPASWALRRRDLKRHRGDHGRLVQQLTDALTQAVDARRAALGEEVFAGVNCQIASRVLDLRWEDELRRLADEAKRLAVLPGPDQALAVTEMRSVAPPDIDLHHEFVARNLVRYFLNIKVEVGPTAQADRTL